MRHAPAVQALGSAVLLQGAALAEVLHLVAVGAQVRQRRDGIPPSPALQDLIAVLARAVDDSPLSPTRQRHVVTAVTSEDLKSVGVPMGSREAAELLGLSVRQIQRSAAVLGGHRIGGRLVFDRDAVIAHQASRRQDLDAKEA